MGEKAWWRLHQVAEELDPTGKYRLYKKVVVDRTTEHYEIVLEYGHTKRKS